MHPGITIAGIRHIALRRIVSLSISASARAAAAAAFSGVTTRGHDRFLIARGRDGRRFEAPQGAGVMLASASPSRYIPDGTNDLS
jgi:hypothetical protein